MSTEIEQNEEFSRVVNTDKQLPNIRVSNRYAGLKVTSLTADIGACGHYRAINPLHMLRMHGATVCYDNVQTLNSMLEYDHIAVPRQYSRDIYEIVRRAQWEGRFVWFEVDDDLHTVLPSSPVYREFYPGSEAVQWCERYMKNAHGLIVSTPDLALAYSRFNTNIAIVENNIDFSLRDWKVKVLWDNGRPVFQPQPIERASDRIVIQYSAGTTHLEDLESMLWTMKRILNDFPNTVFSYYSSLEMFELANKKIGVPLDRVVHEKPRHFMEHPTGLHGCDIGIAPLVHCEFNVSKSPIKLLEGMSAGQAMIGSNVGPYARFEKKHPGSVLLVGNGKGCIPNWYDALAKLIKDEELRRSMQEGGRELAMSRYSLEKNIGIYVLALDSLAKNAVSGNLGPPEKLLPRKHYTFFGTTGRNDSCPCGSSNSSYKSCCKDAWD